MLNGINFVMAMDPACGSGNFLTETYISLRRLENQVIERLNKGQMVLGEMANPVKVSIQQFYGIEINDFACVVAKTAMWIAELQMLEETKELVEADIDLLPLKTYVNIIEGNALQIDWETVVSRERCSYIMGNPPFVGARLMSAEQKKDLLDVYVDEKGKAYKNTGNIDYVSAWFYKASQYMQNTQVCAALVSTNSITQGEQVAPIWRPLIERFGIHLNFAWKTFKWSSESSEQAAVHVVIVGFSCVDFPAKKLFANIGMADCVEKINPYLMPADNVFIENQKHPISEGIPEARSGNKPIDGGFYLFTEEEKNLFLQKEPKAEKYFRPWIGAHEFINRYCRYCLWLGEATPAEIRKMPEVMKRVTAVRDFRLSSKSAGTVKLADNPLHFHVETIPTENFLVLPLTSSERRRYVPIGFITPDYLASNLVLVVPSAGLYHFGVLTSNVFMAWMRTVCGRLEMRYRITKDNVYNNFPWPTPTDAQRAKIEKTAQAILDARALYPDSSLADLYDEVLMPVELRKAHQANDRAVMEAYGFWGVLNTESQCVARLMEMYQQLTQPES